MASQDFAARCGIYCAECEYRAQTSCPGCVQAGGKLFWGTCVIATCCIGKGHHHCGQCAEFPCDTLNSFAYDKEHGDDGQRIGNLEAWNAEGFESWAAKR
ncbi:MAG: DUF3795 domain-containing protein [Anaerolineae bacterium]|nr:DUF3795 domain-containing protein [Anaerolineae bacterium]